MYQLAEGIGLSVEASDSSENHQVVVEEIDQVSVNFDMFHQLTDGRDHHICAT